MNRGEITFVNHFRQISLFKLKRGSAIKITSFKNKNKL